MNKSFVVVLSGMFLFSACGGEKKEAQQEEFVVNESSAPAAAADPIAEGMALVAASDCKTCHHTDNKIIGPSHKEVAQKYEFTEANVKMLAEKIIKGGQGVWGQIPMTPHPDVKQEDAEKMARYVLSLDGETEH
ncbi:MAG: c-type cytochrome [Cyclobacteriaceae bacterium]|jgi:cytochrome c